jgi:hypothetical protein
MDDYSELITRVQCLFRTLQHFDPFCNWDHPEFQAWRIKHGLDHCSRPGELPPQALKVLNRSLEAKLKQISRKH